MHFFKQSADLKRIALNLVALGIAVLAAPAHAQDLFVSNLGDNTISRFAATGPGTYAATATKLTTPGFHSPEGLAFDTRGDLFVANLGPNDSGSILEFTAGATPGTFAATATTLTQSNPYSPFGLAFDTRGDLFAADFSTDTINKFAVGTTPGTFGAVTSLTGPGFFVPVGLAFDARGDLFVTSPGGGIGHIYDSIAEFVVGATPGTFSMTSTLTDSSLSAPIGLAFDARGDLFTANRDGNSITEFTAGATPGTFGMTSTLTDSSLNGPEGLAIDAFGNIFVANENSTTITEFVSTGTGTFGTATTIKTGLSRPAFLAFGPSAPPAVPEASTTVSFGLLLVLGLGGLGVIARRRKTSKPLA